MFSKRIQVAAFCLEGLNSVSTTFYFYHVFFFLRAHFGFGGRENLLWAIGQGAVYVVAAWQGGRLGQRRGYLRTMRWGYAGMTACFLCGWLVNLAQFSRTVEITLQVCLMLLATASICMTWPNLEAVVSEGESGARLQQRIGIYNLIWSGFNALAYFTGGALLEFWGARTQIFLVPAVIMVIQWYIAARMSRWPGAEGPRHIEAPHRPLAAPEERERCGFNPKAFLWMSWLANPCAYVAISAVIPLIPTTAERLGLGPRTAGFFCSLWIFTRTLTFLGLWRWNGWHYRFRWLVLSYLGMMAGFLCIFLSAGAPSLSRGTALAIATVAQIVFGVSLGLIYYSSLFYSMDVGETKGDHGGLHEAAIGIGILGGPLIGAAAQFARPGSATAAAWAVSGVLCIGFFALLWLRKARV